MNFLTSKVQNKNFGPSCACFAPRIFSLKKRSNLLLEIQKKRNSRSSCFFFIFFNLLLEIQKISSVAWSFYKSLSNFLASVGATLLINLERKYEIKRSKISFLDSLWNFKKKACFPKNSIRRKIKKRIREAELKIPYWSIWTSLFHRDVVFFLKFRLGRCFALFIFFGKLVLKMPAFFFKKKKAAQPEANSYITNL